MPGLPSSGRHDDASPSGVLDQQGRPGLADRVPYVVALVDLEEGARVMTDIVGCEPRDVHVGMRVTVTWAPLSDGRNLPLFAPRNMEED